MKSSCLPLLLLLCFSTAHAESVEWQGYVIYYSTFRSTLIPAEVAEAHGIVRSDGRLVTNITVRRNDGPVQARVEGTATNLLNQLFTLDFQEVSEQDAIYYLASQIVDETDTLRYQVEIQPRESDESFTLQFTREYYR
jgi:hypothetical protein